SFLFGRRDEADTDTGTTPRTGAAPTSSPSTSSSNPFDLSGIDPHAPGAFSGLPTPGDPYGSDRRTPPPSSPPPSSTPPSSTPPSSTPPSSPPPSSTPPSSTPPSESPREGPPPAAPDATAGQPAT